MVPSQVIIKEASHTLSTIDRRGRRLLLRRLTALDTLRLFKAAGPTLSQNEAWLSMASLVFCVLEMDGVPMPVPANESQIEGLVDKLGDEGLTAIADLIRDEKSVPDYHANVGNSLGTLS